MQDLKSIPTIKYKHTYLKFRAFVYLRRLNANIFLALSCKILLWMTGYNKVFSSLKVNVFCKLFKIHHKHHSIFDNFNQHFIQL